MNVDTQGTSELPLEASAALERLTTDQAVLPVPRRGELLDFHRMSLSIVFTDDVGIRGLNSQWRGKDNPTDVLSWPLSEVDEPLGDELGDVVVSLETAARQAAVRGWSLADEIALLVVHGVLHLLGHEDDTEEGADAMRSIEARLLGKSLDPLMDKA